MIKTTRDTVHLERWSPVGSVGVIRVEAGEVHQGVRGEEEVGGNHPNGVELGDHDEAHRDEEHEDVASPGIVVGVESLREPRDTGVDTILTDSLGKTLMF